MLGSISPRQFDEWIAFRTIEPDPDTRLREIVLRGLLTLCRAQGIDVEPEHLDPWHEDHEPLMTPEQAVSLLKQTLNR